MCRRGHRFDEEARGGGAESKEGKFASVAKEAATRRGGAGGGGVGSMPRAERLFPGRGAVRQILRLSGRQGCGEAVPRRPRVQRLQPPAREVRPPLRNRLRQQAEIA